MMAISYMIASKRKGIVDPLAITISHPSPYASAGIIGLYRAYGEEPPIMGQMSTENPRGDKYVCKIYETFGKEGDTSPVQSAVKLLRKTLAESDGEVTLCAIGPLTNIAGLLESTADEISHLDGASLMEEKCSRLVLMAGGFEPDENGKNRPEFNVKVDAEASQKVFKLCRNEIYTLPFEVALTMITGKRAVEILGESHPLTMAFIGFHNSIGRASWDPATLLWAVEGDRDLFKLSEAGKIVLDEIGTTDFYPDENGKHYVIGLAQKENEAFTDAQIRVADYINAAVYPMLGI